MSKRARTEEGNIASSSRPSSGARSQRPSVRDKILLLEKGINLAEIEDDRFTDILNEKGWLKLASSPVQPNETLVKEFYQACVQKKADEEFRVRGKPVEITRSLVNSFYYLGDVNQGIKNGLDIRIDSVSQFGVLKAYPNPSNPTSDVVYSELTISDALLINMLRSVVIPRKSASRLEKIEKQFLICVKRGWKIDIGELVILHMKKLISNLKSFPKKQQYLFYPSLITGLLKDQGVPFSRKDAMAVETEAMGKVLMKKVKKSRGGKDTPEVGVPAQRRPRSEQPGGSSEPFSVPIADTTTPPVPTTEEPAPPASTSTVFEIPVASQPQPTQPQSSQPADSEPPVQQSSVGGQQEILAAINVATTSLRQEIQEAKQSLERKMEEQVHILCNKWKEEFLSSITDPFQFAEEWRRNREAQQGGNDEEFNHWGAGASVPSPVQPIPPEETHSSPVHLISVQEVPQSPVLPFTSPSVELHLFEKVLPALPYIRIRELQERPGASIASTFDNQMVLFVPLPQPSFSHSRGEHVLQDNSDESVATISPSQWSSPMREMLDAFRDSEEDSPLHHCFIVEQRVASARAAVQDTASTSTQRSEPTDVQQMEVDSLIPTPLNQMVLYLPPAEPLSIQPQEPQFSDLSDVSGSSNEWPSPVKKIVREVREMLHTPIPEPTQEKLPVQPLVRPPIFGQRRSRGPIKISEAEEPFSFPAQHSKTRRRKIGDSDDPTVHEGEVVPDSFTVDVTVPYVQVPRKRTKSKAKRKSRTKVDTKTKEIAEATPPPQKRITRADTKQKEIAKATPTPQQQQELIKDTSPPKKRRRLVKKYSDSPPVADLMLTPRNPTLDTPPTTRRLSMARDESEPEDSL